MTTTDRWKRRTGANLPLWARFKDWLAELFFPVAIHEREEEDE